MRFVCFFFLGLAGCGQVYVERDETRPDNGQPSDDEGTPPDGVGTPPDDVKPPLPEGACPQGEPLTLANLQTPSGMALGEDKLYFTDLAGLYDCNGRVLSVPLAGGEPEVLVTGICAPNRIVYADGMLYWLNHSGYVAPNGDLTSLDLKSGELASLAGGLIAPDALAVDERYVYVGADKETELQSPGRLLRVDRQTSEMVELAVSPGRVADIALDTDYIYWTSSVGFLNGQPNQDSAVYRISKQGGDVTLLVDGLSGAYALARAGTQVFVVHPEAGEILALSPDGTSKSLLAEGLVYPNDVASDGEQVVVTTWGPPSDLFLLENTGPAALAKTIGYADQVVLGASCVYWTEQYVDDEFNGVLRAMAR